VYSIYQYWENTKKWGKQLLSNDFLVEVGGIEQPSKLRNKQAFPLIKIGKSCMMHQDVSSISIQVLPCVDGQSFA